MEMNEERNLCIVEDILNSLSSSREKKHVHFHCRRKRKRNETNKRRIKREQIKLQNGSKPIYS